MFMQLGVKEDLGTLFCFLNFAMERMGKSCSLAFRERVIRPKKTMNSVLHVYLSVPLKQLSGYVE